MIQTRNCSEKIEHFLRDAIILDVVGCNPDRPSDVGYFGYGENIDGFYDILNIVITGGCGN
jgi:hypothetical protein